MSAVTTALPAGISSMAVEAQRLMALSVNKIVASRSRRGGISLHRNLLVAGVLFRARDALLAAGKMPSLASSSSSSSSSSPSSGSPSAAEKQHQQPDQISEDANRNSVSSASATSTEAPMQQSQSEPQSDSAASETGPCDNREASTTDADVDRMDVEVVGKENVPPPTSVAAQPTTATPDTAETGEAKTCDNLKNVIVAAARKRRCSETSCPVVSKSVKTCTSSSPSSMSSPSTVAADSRTRSSSVPTCNSRASSKRVTNVSPKTTSSSLSIGGSTVAVSPVVYLNRVDVAFCSTPGIGGGIMGSVRPVLVVQVV